MFFSDRDDGAAAWNIIFLGSTGIVAGLVLHMAVRKVQLFSSSSSFSDPKSKRLPPTERGWLPFLGVGLSFFKNVNQFLSDRHQQHGDEAPFRVYLMGKYWTFVYSLEDIKSIINGREQDVSFLQGFKDLMDRLMPKGFPFIPRHSFFLLTLREANLRLFIKMMEDSIEAELAKWQKVGQINLFETTRVLIMKLNLHVLLGPKLFQGGKFEAYYNAFEEIDPEKSLVNFLASILSPSKKEKAWTVISNITKELLKEYQQRVVVEEKKEGEEDDAECVLHLLTRAASKEKQELVAEKVVADVFAFVIASFTNSFAVLAWCIYELSEDQKLQERFMKEGEGRKRGSFDELEASMVGKAIVDETIRLHTPGLFFRKVVIPEGVTLPSGHHVPYGDYLSFSARYLATLPTFYQDPLSFDIDRYLIRDEKKGAGMYALQWGGGRHACLGAKFAQTEIIIILAYLFERFDLTPGPESPVVSKSQIATADKPIKSVYISYARRTSAESK